MLAFRRSGATAPCPFAPFTFFVAAAAVDSPKRRRGRGRDATHRLPSQTKPQCCATRESPRCGCTLHMRLLDHRAHAAVSLQVLLRSGWPCVLLYALCVRGPFSPREGYSAWSGSLSRRRVAASLGDLGRWRENEERCHGTLCPSAVGFLIMPPLSSSLRPDVTPHGQSLHRSHGATVEPSSRVVAGQALWPVSPRPPLSDIACFAVQAAPSRRATLISEASWSFAWRLVCTPHARCGVFRDLAASGISGAWARAGIHAMRGILLGPENPSGKLHCATQRGCRSTRSAALVRLAFNTGPSN